MRNNSLNHAILKATVRLPHFNQPNSRERKTKWRQKQESSDTYINKTRIPTLANTQSRKVNVEREHTPNEAWSVHSSGWQWERGGHGEPCRSPWGTRCQRPVTPSEPREHQNGRCRFVEWRDYLWGRRWIDESMGLDIIVCRESEGKWSECLEVSKNLPLNW